MTLSESTWSSRPEAIWCPETQTFKGGIVPHHSDTTLTIEELLACNGDKLKIFGYGSLCWHPGTDGVLSLANIEQDEHDHDVLASSSSSPRPKRKVTTAPGRAIGYRRCWAQRSADHRGDTEFNGIVCTLLSDEEFAELQAGGGEQQQQQQQQQQQHQSMTEGLIYTVSKDLVQDCLAELDFREKGGYARDTIDVIEDVTGEQFKALLYRGTSENPAFWQRVLFDLPLAAAVMSVAKGPSGPNDFYLMQLHSFLVHAAKHSPAAATALEEHSGDDQTEKLAHMCKLLQTDYMPFFLFGAGSNEHNQLLLNSDNGSVEEKHELVEMLLIVPRNTDGVELQPKALHAGGGHSGLLTNTGELYLWGWNESGQLGSISNTISDDKDFPFSRNVVRPLPNIKVEHVSLGHNHTTLIEKGTGRLFCFGENGRGQVDISSTDTTIHTPLTPFGLSEDFFIDISAGLFHSAAITKDGELVTWGCGRFGQSLKASDDSTSKVGRWRPRDGVQLKQVSCGRRHTVILDEVGRVWTMGDNKYGQLGRSNTSNHAVPELVSGPLGLPNSGCVQIESGWSHSIAIVKKEESNRETGISLFGWGRNDKGQLGYKSTEKFVNEPQQLKPNNGDIEVTSVCCGAESSLIVDADEKIYCCGWNEHGNLAFESSDSCFTWRPATGVKVVGPPTMRNIKLLAASGGAHTITMKV